MESLLSHSQVWYTHGVVEAKARKFGVNKDIDGLFDMSSFLLSNSDQSIFAEFLIMLGVTNRK